MERQHPVETEGDMYLARQAIIAAHIRRDIEERLLVKGTVGVLRPAVLIAFEDIEAFHRTAADSAAYIRPDFV